MTKRLGQYGFSLIELLFTAVIGSFIALTVSTVLAWSAQNQSRAMVLSDIEAYKQNFLAILKSETAWRNTLNANPSMACILNIVPCPTNVPTHFVLYDNLNQPFYDSSNTATGLTTKGLQCPNFSSPWPNFPTNAGSDDCPFRYEMTWTALCPAGSCVIPQIVVNAHLYYRPAPNSKSRIVVDEDRYSINNFYFDPSPCFTNTQIFAVPGSWSFAVPAKYHVLIAEVWGGGGGGAAVLPPPNISSNCITDPGLAGGNSTFGGLSGSGGAPGVRAGGGFFWQFFCTSINGSSICGFGAWDQNYCGGIDPNISFPVTDPNCAPNDVCIGADGQTGTPPGPTPPPSMCATQIGNTGNNGSGKGSISYSGNGNTAGGSGAGSPLMVASFPIPPCGCACSGWCTLFFYSVTGEGGGGWQPTGTGTTVLNTNHGIWSGTGGQYNAQSFSPGTLAPGSVVPVQVGAGGLGGQVPPRPQPPSIYGGNGAPGMVKITWW